MPSPPLRFLVPDANARIDRLVADASGRGRRPVKRWLQLGLVRVDGRRANPGDVPPRGAMVEVLADEPLQTTSPAASTSAQLVVVLETDSLVVIAKPASLHCERGRSAGSVAELLEQRYGDLGGIGARPAEAGLVHRLDHDTSGVLVAARTAAAYLRLRRAFSQGRTRKQYLALVAGVLDRPLRVDLPLAARGDRMAIATKHDDPLAAETLVHPLEVGAGWSLLLVTMRSGVRHQVRAHLAYDGFPLIGDELYGGPLLPDCSRTGQLLHALRLEVEGEIDVTVGPPADFLAALAWLRRHG